MFLGGIFVLLWSNSTAMNSKITADIFVSVDPEYDKKTSFPSDNRYVFRYNIHIKNMGMAPVQLFSRRWMIYGVGYGFTEVAGEGVIGLKPELLSGEHFNYFSHVVLQSGIGVMYGTYTFINLETKEIFDVEIPKFQLHSEVLCN